MLGSTSKTRQSLSKSAKLPKLSIQQQMENQNIIDRMNRKITYTKNPRHLGKALQFK